MNESEIIKTIIIDSIDTKRKIYEDEKLINIIASVVNLIFESICCGGKMLVCGNGGSSSDSLHMVGEIVGRFKKDRRAWPAIALNADVATMTAVANDYGYNTIFERSTEAYMTRNDILFGISTSGNSENVFRAIKKAKEIGGRTILLTGKDGGIISNEVDITIKVPSFDTARIQESHIMIIHIICELLEEKLTNE